jgi:hypothetical protein
MQENAEGILFSDDGRHASTHSIARKYETAERVQISTRLTHWRQAATLQVDTQRGW